MLACVGALHRPTYIHTYIHTYTEEGGTGLRIYSSTLFTGLNLPTNKKSGIRHIRNKQSFLKNSFLDTRISVTNNKIFL
jgi:hypothetical protein